MKIIFILTLAVLWSVSAEARKRPAPLRDPILLNIGYVCSWQNRCISRQQRAMKSSLGYVKKYQPPAWQVKVCNRNSSRDGTRKDWIGFNNCIRNPEIRPPPTKKQKRRR